ncbi:MAG: ExbD/TolR family protein [Bdellovibrionia bacterium]
MLKRPTSRSKRDHKQIELNLVPILDTMVTLIGFLLFTTSFLSLVSIESPFPMASPSEVVEKIKEKPLQLTLTLRDNEAELWSPFEKIQSIKIPNVTPGSPDVNKIHEALVGVKQKFLDETKLVVVPEAGTNYDILISVMDSVRAVETTDTPIYRKTAAGAEEVVKTLFPEVIFGNLLENDQARPGRAEK